MAVNQIMLELVEEMVKPEEIALDNKVEDAIEAEDDVTFGTAESDDDIIEFIANGGKLGYEDPIDFSDEVEEVLAYDLED